MLERKKHILVISQYFYPEQFRINDIAKEWFNRGYEVTVVTGIPNYPQGEFYEGYDKRHRRNEKWNGINIIRLSIAPRKTGTLNMIKNYLSFVWSGLWWIIKSKLRADYVFNFEVSPMTQALIGIWFAKKHKIPCYLYVQDLWPENVEIVTGIHSPLIIYPLNRMVNYIYKNCTHIFGTSPSFVMEIQKRCSDQSKVTYWPQYAESFYTKVERSEALAASPEIPNDGRFKVIFTGNIGQAQGLEILPVTAKYLKERKVDIEFVIVGDGRNKLNFIEQIKAKKVEEMFIMINRQSAECIPSLLASCDAAFISFIDNELFAKTIPAKLQSYMACGMPIIASASGETVRVIEEAQCGMCSSIGDPTSLAYIIEEMSNADSNRLQAMSNNSKRYCDINFSKDMLMDQMNAFFK